ncbi:MAG: glycerol-3-phosphate dehydrogenase C-terminal domain-containing protein, partial [Planctomycetota bacterium]
MRCASLPRSPDRARRVLATQIRYAIRSEMAQTLKDVIFRRTDLGSA